MGFKGTPETERLIAQTVDALIACPKNREPRLIQRLQALWARRKRELASQVKSASPAP